MAKMKVWFDEEGDFLEVIFADRKGTSQEIAPDVYERVDARGNVIGWSDPVRTPADGKASIQQDGETICDQLERPRSAIR